MFPVITSALASSLKFLATVIPIFAVGIVAAEFLVELGWVDRIGWLARPLTALGHLKPECGVSFLTAFVSPAAGNSMLVRYHDAGRIGRRELLIAAIANTFPGIVMHWRTMLPVALPLIGPFGLAYYGFLVLVGLIKTGLALLMGRFLLKAGDPGASEDRPEDVRARPRFRDALANSVRKSQKTFLRIVRTTVPITIGMFLLIEAGAFDLLNERLEFFTEHVPLPPEALSIVLTRIGSNIGAFTVAGNLLSTRIVAGRDVVLALLIGNVLATGVNVRYLIPYYFGIFGPGLGVRVLTLSMGLRIVVMLGLIGVLFATWR